MSDSRSPDRPDTWKKLTIKEIATLGRKPPSSLLDGKVEVSFLPMACVEEESGRIQLGQVISATEGKRRSLTYFEDGDVLFAKITPCMENGKVAVAKGLQNGAAFGSSEFYVLCPQEETVLPEYLNFVLVDPSFRSEAARAMTGAVGQQRVPRRFIEDFQLGIPPLSEQREIVRILEEQFSRLDAAAASIAAVRRKADQFRRSLLNEAFSGEMTASPSGMSERNVTRNVNWEVHRLGDCLQKLKSGKLAERGWSPQCSNHPSSDEGSWGVLKTTAVQMGEFRPEHNKELPTTLTPKASLEVEDGDFLLITTSPRNRCGVVCQVKNTRKKLIFSGKILRFRVDEEKVLANWLMSYLMSPKSQEELDVLKVGTSDSSVSIGNSQILDLTIPVAPLEEQRLVTSLLDEEMARLDALLQAAKTAEIRVAALRRSLLMAAFSGELTREWREKNHG